MNKPSAANRDRNIAQRAIRSCGVCAVSLSEGTRNCGGGPGFGPTANVNAPRTGWPSTEIARQKTRYQPSGTVFSGTTIVFGSAGERLGGPAVSWFASWSVTETIAKRGSTGSPEGGAARGGRR